MWGKNSCRFCFLGWTGATMIATIFGQGEVVIIEGVWMIETFLSHTQSVDAALYVNLRTLLGPECSPVTHIES